MINILKALVEKMENMNEQMVISARDGNHKKESNEKTRKKNTVTEMKHPVSGLINRFNIIKKRINECEGRSTEITKSETQSNKDRK